MESPQNVRLTVYPSGILLGVAVAALVFWLIGTDTFLPRVEDTGKRITWLVGGPALIVFIAGLGSIRIATEFVPGSPHFFRTHRYFFLIDGQRQGFPLERLSSIELRHPAGDLKANTAADSYFAMPWYYRRGLGLLLLYRLWEGYSSSGPYELYANMEGYRYLLARSSNRELAVEWGNYLAWLTGRRLE